MQSQKLIRDASGRLFIEGDWHHDPLPRGISTDPTSYLDTSFSFTRFHSEKENSFEIGYGSGNYGHSNFMSGPDGKISIGKFVVLQGTTLIANLSITIKDHCMFSWGSIITDSWVDPAMNISDRRKILESTAASKNRNVDFLNSKPVVIEENVWVGFKAVVLPGVTLGRGCIVGSCSVISEDVPPYAIIVGNPARIVRYLDASDTDDIRKKALEDLKVI